MQFDIDGEYAKSRQRAFRVYAVLLVVFFAVVVAVCTLMQIVYGADTTIFMLIGVTSFNGCRLVCAFDISKLFR